MKNNKKAEWNMQVSHKIDKNNLIFWTMFTLTRDQQIIHNCGYIQCYKAILRYIGYEEDNRRTYND